MRYFIFIVWSINFLLSGTISYGQNVGDCFLNDFNLKSAITPLYQKKAKTTADPTLIIQINTQDTLGRISPYLFGNNFNLWMGQVVTDTVLLNHLQMLSPKILRFPGGNISNVYFWDAPVDQPPSDVPDSLFDANGEKIPSNFWWYGKNNAENTLSLENYYRLLKRTDSEGLICINFGYSRYGTGPNPLLRAAKYAADWVRFDNGRTKFWEIGNENFGPWQAGYKIDTKRNRDNQPEIINGQLYGKHFRVFVDSMREAANEIGSEIYIGAQLIENLEKNSWMVPARTWNNAFFKEAGDLADFYVVHSYFTNYLENSTADAIFKSITEVKNISDYIKESVIENVVHIKPIALTEWNIFATGSKQMVSFINGIHATLVLGELAKNNISMACRWDLANGYDNGNDHGMFNKGDEPGVPQWNPRPDFFYFYFFQKFTGNHLLRTTVPEKSGIFAYASIFDKGQLNIVLINTGMTEQIIELTTDHSPYRGNYYIYTLTGGNDNGEFSTSVYVNGIGPDYKTGGPIETLKNIPAWAYPIEDEIKLLAPPRSVQFILIEKQKDDYHHQ